MSGSHLVISGTGRAGTTFLVQWLDACGLDCGDLSELGYDEEGQCGLERPLRGSNIPRVVKDPWLHTYCQEVDLVETPVEALILPVRNLQDAAESRIRRELKEIFRLHGNWSPDHFGHTPGGAIYSLTVTDEMRLLAVGFHQLVRWAAKAEIEVVLLDYPRLAEDAWYLVGKMQPWLPNLLEAIDAHSKVRLR